MTSDSPADSGRDFLTVATEMKMLTKQAVVGLLDESKTRSITPTALALHKGLLTTVQVDIVETLLHPSETIPDFDVLELIGQGGMGVVYRARQRNLDRIVALKTVLVSQMANPTALARFEQEAVTVGRLRHPNVVAAYDFGKFEGRLYFAMELVEGEDAERLIKRSGRLEEAVAWGLARQAASALAYAAREQIVHRDIKPANLLLVEPPEGFSLPHGLPMVKVGDFGLALLAADSEAETRLTSANATLGSPHYMAPEQLTDTNVDYRADIYSLGATLFHMLSGRAPYAGKSVTNIMADKLQGNSPEFDYLPPSSTVSNDLVRRMMSADRDERPSTYTEILELAGQILNDADATSTAKVWIEPTRIASSSGPDTPTRVMSSADQPVSKFSPSRRNFITLVAGTAVCALGGGLLWRTLASRARSVERDMVPSGSGQILFNGQDLNGWSVIGGAWSTALDEEGGRVLGGTNGAITRQFPAAEGAALAHFRLTLLVTLNEASAAEVHFGVDPENNADAHRTVVRLTKTAAVLGERIGDAGEFLPLSPPVDMPSTASSLHVVFIERQRQGWWTSVNDQPLGTSPFQHPHLAETRLRVERGPAWFSDIMLQQLAPATSN